MSIKTYNTRRRALMKAAANGDADNDDGAPAAVDEAAAAVAAAAAAAKQPPPQLPPLTRLESIAMHMAVASITGAIALSGLLLAAAAAALAFAPASPFTWLLLALVAALAAVPLGKPPRWVGAGVAYACRGAARYFPARVIVEPGAQFSRGGRYLIALEPHSALPTAMPVAFGVKSALLPPALRGRTHGLVSSVCFRFPLVRHVYFWWGFRPATRAAARRVLTSGRVAVLVPGGVRECLEMDPQGRYEVAFVRKRKGFIRLAMAAGADVVPAWAFGQTAAFRWRRPGPPLVPAAVVARVSRAIGMVPMLLWGRWGTLVPLRAPLTVALGASLGLPHAEDPPDAEVQRWLDRYVAALTALHARHKAAAGCPDEVLRVL